MLTPEEIERKRFPMDLRGYDKVAVETFLVEVAAAFRESSQAGPDPAVPPPDPVDHLLERMGGLVRAAMIESDRLVEDAKREAAEIVGRERDAAAGRARLADEKKAEALRMREAAERHLTVAEDLLWEAQQEAAEIVASAKAEAEAIRRAAAVEATITTEVERTETAARTKAEGQRVSDVAALIGRLHEPVTASELMAELGQPGGGSGQAVAAGSAAKDERGAGAGADQRKNQKAGDVRSGNGKTGGRRGSPRGR